MEVDCKKVRQSWLRAPYPTFESLPTYAKEHMRACPECMGHFRETLLLHCALSSLPAVKAGSDFTAGVMAAIRIQNSHPELRKKNPWNLVSAAVASLLLMILCNYVVGGPGGAPVEAAVHGSVKSAVVSVGTAGDTLRGLLHILNFNIKGR